MSMKRKHRDKKIQKTIADERIKKLFFMAEKMALLDNFDLSDRYVDIARKISMRNLVPIPREFKRSYCKYCYSYFLPDYTCKIRIRRGKLIIHCNNCKKITRFLLKNDKKLSSARLK